MSDPLRAILTQELLLGVHQRAGPDRKAEEIQLDGAKEIGSEGNTKTFRIAYSFYDKMHNTSGEYECTVIVDETGKLVDARNPRNLWA